MKRLLIIFMIVTITLSLSACAKDADTVSTVPVSESEAVTEAPDEKPTQKPTDPPTEAPTEPSYTVIAQSSGETAALSGEGYFTYTNRKYGWSVDVPEVWNEYGYIIEYDDTGKVEFKHEASFFSDYHLTGDIFSMVTLPAGSTFYTANGSTGTDIYQDDENMVCWDKPSDVQTDYENYKDEIEQLKETRDRILESFRWE